jgi:hypothetical protein
MDWMEWGKVAAPIIGAVIGATFVALGWRVGHRSRRRGNWESIKTDLEIAEMLPPGDEMRFWLTSYADLRLRRYAKEEVRYRAFRPGAALLALLGTSVFLVGLLAIPAYRAWTEEAGGWHILIPVLVGLVAGALAQSDPTPDVLQTRWRKLKFPWKAAANADEIAVLRSGIAEYDRKRTACFTTKNAGDAEGKSKETQASTGAAEAVYDKQTPEAPPKHSEGETTTK